MSRILFSYFSTIILSVIQIAKLGRVKLIFILFGKQLIACLNKAVDVESPPLTLNIQFLFLTQRVLFCAIFR